MQKPSRILVLGTRSALLTFTVLRVVLGIVMAAHGLQKLMDPAQYAQHFAQLGLPLPGAMVYLAIAGELLGGLGLIVGFLTPIAAFGVAATMLVAILSAHIDKGLFAANGGFEYPLILMCSALWYMAAGGGPYSLDAMIRAARDERIGRGTPYARATAGSSSPAAPLDVVTQAGNESFPASDSPAHSSRH